MLPEEQAENSRYFYELASGRFGWSIEKVRDVQAFHFKFGQGAKTGTGGHLPGNKVVGRIAEVRGLEVGTPAVSPATFPDLTTIDDYRDARRPRCARRRAASPSAPSCRRSTSRPTSTLRSRSASTTSSSTVAAAGPAPHRRSSATTSRSRRSRRWPGPAVTSTPATRRSRWSSPAVSEATPTSSRRSRSGPTRSPCRTPPCRRSAASGMRACNTDNCPVGIATQQPGLRQRLVVEDAAQRLTRFFGATVELMRVLARACGHSHLERADASTTSPRSTARCIISPASPTEASAA